MNTQTEANWIYQELLRSNDPSLIERIKNMLLAKRKDEIIPELGTTVEQYNRDLDEGTAQYRNGDYLSDEDFEREMNQW